MSRMGAQNRRRRKRVLLAKHAGKCFWCKTELTYETATLDHLEPMSKGGRDRMTNLVIACEPCNRARGCWAKPHWTVLDRVRMDRRAT